MVTSFPSDFCEKQMLFCWKSRLLECGISTAVALCCQCSQTIGKIFSPTELWTRYLQRRHNQFYVDVEEHAGGPSNSVPLVLATVSLSSETILHTGGIFPHRLGYIILGKGRFFFFFSFSFFLSPLFTSLMFLKVYFPDSDCICCFYIVSMAILVKPCLPVTACQP